MSAHDVHRRIEQIARRQDGVFNLQQAAEAGATERIRRRRVANGDWIKLDRGVFSLPSHTGTWNRQCRAALLTIDRAALTDTTAAAFQAVTGFRAGGVHIVVPPGTNHRTRLATVHESSWPRIGVVDGFRTVELPDVFFQLAGHTDEARLRRAFEDAIVAHHDLLARLRDRYVELAALRLWGIGRIRALLDDHDDAAAPAESELERQLGRLLGRCAAIPAWTRQAPLPGWERGAARVDVLVPAWRLVIEADGRRWHTRVDDFERDRWRDNVATTAGYDILRFSHHQLTTNESGCLALLTRYADRHRAP